MKNKFFNFLEEVSDKIQDYISKNKRFLIVTHIDADGLSSATLLLHFLYYNNVEAHLTYAKQLEDNYLKNLYSKYPEDIFVFLDLGSGIIDRIEKYTNKETIIIDHHDLVSKNTQIGNNIIQINPRIFGIDGSREISTSGIVYYLLKSMDYDFEDITFLSLVGAIGDLQENEEFLGINKEILDELIKEDIIEIRKGLKIFGYSSKPLYKALSLSTEIYIPGITGDENKALEFLNKVGIPLKKGGNMVTYADLDKEEEKKLISEIIKIRLQNSIPNAENVIGNIYIVKNDKFYFKDLKEIAYLYNAAGRLEKPFIPILYFLGDKRYLGDLQDIQVEYKKEMIKILNNIFSRKIEIKEENGISIIDLSKYNIKDTFVSPIASLLSNIKFVKGKLLIVFSSQDDKYYKISVRIVGEPLIKNLANIVRESARKVEGFGGGHDVAAGAIIPKDKLEEFIKNLRIAARQESILI